MQEDTIIKFIRTNIAIIGVIVALIVQWTTLRNKLDSNDERLTKVELRYESSLKDLSDVKIQLAELKGLMEAIRIQIGDLKKTQ